MPCLEKYSQSMQFVILVKIGDKDREMKTRNDDGLVKCVRCSFLKV